MTANRFNRRPSELVELDDPAIALAFDLECAEVLFEWESKQKTTELQAMMTGQIARELGGASQHTPKTREITSANFGDQKF